jgi:hypothetical protein
VPLPHRRLRRLAATLPGLHELLPTYRCVDEGDEVRRLTPDDVAALGGDRGLAEAAAAMHARTAGVALPGHEVVIGDAQTTAQTLRLGAGVVTEGYYDFEVHSDGDLVRDGDGILRRVPAFGDGTVPARSATPAGPRAQPLPQQHGSLARTADAIGIVRAAILGRHLGGRLGEGDIGIRTPTWCGRARNGRCLSTASSRTPPPAPSTTPPPTSPSTPSTRCTSATARFMPP